MSAFVLKIRFLSAVQNCCLSIFLHLPHAGCRRKEHQVKQMSMYDQLQSSTLKHLLKIEVTTYLFRQERSCHYREVGAKKPHSPIAPSPSHTVNTARIFQRLRGSTKSLSCNKCMNGETQHIRAALTLIWAPSFDLFKNKPK